MGSERGIIPPFFLERFVQKVSVFPQGPACSPIHRPAVLSSVRTPVGGRWRRDGTRIHWRQHKPVAAQREAEAVYCVPCAPLLACSLGRACFCQDVHSSALPLGGTYSRQEPQYSVSSRASQSDSCPQIAVVGLREAHH